MVNTVDISKWLWPLSLFDNRRRVTAYGKSRGEVLHAADLYLQSLVEEVAEASGRSVDWGRFLFWSGHLLFWVGLLLSLVGLLTLDKAHLERLLWGPFGIGLLMQLPSGALVRAGRRILRPSAQELAAVDRRAPVLLLRSFRGGLRVEELAPSVRDALSQVGPLSLAVGAADGARFGEADWERVATLAIDQARLLVMMPGDPAAVETEIEAIAKRRHAHKLLVLLPPNSAENDKAAIWPALRAALVRIPGYSELPEELPSRLLAVHLTSAGEATLVTAPLQPESADVDRALLFALYGMKVHGRW